MIYCMLCKYWCDIYIYTPYVNNIYIVYSEVKYAFKVYYHISPCLETFWNRHMPSWPCGDETTWGVSMRRIRLTHRNPGDTQYHYKSHCSPVSLKPLPQTIGTCTPHWETFGDGQWWSSISRHSELGRTQKSTTPANASLANIVTLVFLGSDARGW